MVSVLTHSNRVTSARAAPAKVVPKALVLSTINIKIQALAHSPRETQDQHALQDPALTLSQDMVAIQTSLLCLPVMVAIQIPAPLEIRVVKIAPLRHHKEPPSPKVIALAHQPKAPAFRRIDGSFQRRPGKLGRLFCVHERLAQT